MTADKIENIRSLVGEVSQEQLRYVECFMGRRVALFVPAVGPCLYAVTPDHSHPGYSFFLNFDDKTRIAANGEIVAMAPGRVLAMTPGAVHHELPSELPPRYIAVFVDKHSSFERELDLYRPVKGDSFAFRSFLPAPELLPLLKDFMREAASRLPGRDALLDASGTKIVHSLIRSALGVSPGADRIGERVEIHRVIEHLHSRYPEKVTVAGLAGIAAMSTAHFSRVFRRETGHSPFDYLIRLRLQKARLLLLADEDNITAVSLRCGFATPSHFTSCFQRHYGMNPSEYRKRRG